MLERIKTSADLKQLNQTELDELCSEIRHELIHTVSENGGHLIRPKIRLFLMSAIRAMCTK